MKLHLPYEFNGKPTSPIVGFSIGPMGPDREAAKKKLFDEDPRLHLDYISDSEFLRKRAQGVIRSRLDVVYNIEPGETVDVPANHAEKLREVFGFLVEGEPQKQTPAPVEAPQAEAPATEPEAAPATPTTNSKK